MYLRRADANITSIVYQVLVSDRAIIHRSVEKSAQTASQAQCDSQQAVEMDIHRSSCASKPMQQRLDTHKSSIFSIVLSYDRNDTYSLSVQEWRTVRWRTFARQSKILYMLVCVVCGLRDNWSRS